MAPAAPAAALIGPGPTEVASVLPWDSPEAAALLTGDAPLPPGLSAALATFEAAVVYSRSSILAQRLQGLVPRVVVRDPQPPAAAGHASTWYRGALDALGVPSGARDLPTIAPTREEAAAADPLVRELPEAFLALHPGSGSPGKKWPAERFGALAATLSAERPYALIEGPADREAVESVRARAPQCLVLPGLPLRTLGAVLACAGFYVGNDSGVSHLAAAYGAPCLALFGPTDPAVWSPVGPRVATLRF